MRVRERKEREIGRKTEREKEREGEKDRERVKMWGSEMSQICKIQDETKFKDFIYTFIFEIKL